MVKIMKKTIVFLMLIFLLGCIAKAPIQDAMQDVEEETIMKVPASGFEDVDEMIVEQDASSVKEFRIEAFKYDFEPAVIEVDKGDKVRLIVISTDVDHGIAIPEYGISLGAPVGEEVSVEFVADKTGEFRFYCNVYCGSGHKEMAGKLLVR
jgi:cytochrome c oxidase subunit II